MSVREIMIKGHFLVTLVVSTGQTHNFGNLRPAIPWSPMYRLLIPYIKPSVRESMIKSHWAPGLWDWIIKINSGLLPAQGHSMSNEMMAHALRPRILFTFF